jgi:hypothetical protein
MRQTVQTSIQLALSIILSLVYILLTEQIFFTVLFFWCTMVHIYNKSNGQLL